MSVDNVVSWFYPMDTLFTFKDQHSIIEVSYIHGLWGLSMAILITLLMVISYFAIVLAIIPVLLKVFFRVPNEIVRKLQHIGFASSVFFFSERGHLWWEIVYMLVLFGSVIFFMMWAIEKTPRYKQMFVDRRKKGGEMKLSLGMAIVTFVLLFALFGGILPNAEYSFVVIAVMSWGIGDAVAALFGKYLGRKKLHAPGLDPNKTWFGSVSMALSVAVVVFFMVLFYALEPWWVALISAILIAITATTIEAYSKKGIDTMSIPLGVATILYALHWIFILVLGA